MGMMTVTDDERPQVIETDMAPLSGADKWLTKARKRVAETAAQFNAYEINDSSTLAQAKRERASIRRDIEEIDNDRKTMTRVIDDAVKRFRADTKDVLRPLTQLDAEYKAQIDAYGERRIQRKMQELNETYVELAPFMATPSDDGRPLVTFDRIVETYGMGQRGKKWALAGTSVEDARNQLIEALKEIQESEAVITSTVAPEDVDVARSIYFDTLDLTATLREVENRKRQRQRLEALEADRRAMAEYEAMRNDDERDVADSAEPEPTPEPTPMPTPEPAPEPVVARDEGQWVFAGYGTKSQADKFIAWCELHGVTRKVAQPTNGYDYRLSVRR